MGWGDARRTRPAVPNSRGPAATCAAGPEAVRAGCYSTRTYAVRFTGLSGSGMPANLTEKLPLLRLEPEKVAEASPKPPKR